MAEFFIRANDQAAPFFDGVNVSTQNWSQNNITTDAGVATQVLAENTARYGLIVINESASENIRIRFDGSNATVSAGLPLAAGKGISFAAGNVPSEKISVYSTNAANVYVAWC